MAGTDSITQSRIARSVTADINALVRRVTEETTRDLRRIADHIAATIDAPEILRQAFSRLTPTARKRAVKRDLSRCDVCHVWLQLNREERDLARNRWWGDVCACSGSTCTCSTR
jgi:hypothetical protein